jgi:NADH-quinone oxidoreductase subunit M
MLNHGISTGGLFLIVGMLSDRRHTRQIAEYGGLKHVTPRLVAAFLIITLSSIGMPGLNGFIGEFLTMLGAYRWRPVLAAVAATGVILSAVYMLWMFQRVNYGPLNNPKNKTLHDLEPREWAALGPTVVMAIVMGVVPNFFLAPMAPSVDRLVQRLHAQRPAFAEATAGRPEFAKATAGKAEFAAATADKPARDESTAGRPAPAGAVPLTTPKPVPASASLTPEQAAR